LVQFSSLSYQERAKITKNRVAQNLLQIMNTKQSNLCVSAGLSLCLSVCVCSLTRIF
jgi:hypothetical protein